MPIIKTLRKPRNVRERLNAFGKRNLYVWTAFFVPLALMLIAFALMDVSPLGQANKQILVTDLWHQYYPFLVDFQDKLQHGESLFWTWSVGSGVNYFALMSYYLASPLNFLSIFVSPDHLREFLMFSVAVKISLAGSFMAYFLKSVYKRNDISIVIFGISFSFCAFFMGYYWNTIWLDTVSITPLVALGAVKLLTENRFRLYTVMLALSLVTNYYIGFFTCIFILLIFICYNIVRWQSIKVFAANFLKIAIFTIIGIGLAAFFILPIFMALQNTHASGSSFPRDFAINIGGTNDLLGVLKGLKSISGNLVNFTVAANKEIDAMPNIACGAIPLFFAFLSLTSREIKLREKLVSVGLVLFMFLSFIIRQFDYIWHGFHFPNMIYYRFSYLVSFVIIVMGFRAFMNLKKTGLVSVIIASLLSFFVLLMEFDFTGTKNPDGEGPYDQGVFDMFAVKGHSRPDRMGWVDPTLITVAVLFALIAVLLILYSKRVIPIQAVVVSLLIVAIAQSGYTAYFGVNVTTVTGMDGYPRGGTDTETIVDYMKDREKDTPELWRAETTTTQTLNDGALNHYHGLSMFNSMANESMTLFYENFGMGGWQAGNRYTYKEGSPVTNLFMNLKYLISRDGNAANTYDLSEVADEGSVKLYENNHYLPMGFMVNSELLNWEEIREENSFNQFDKQNEFFELATGIKTPVYTRVEVKDEEHTDSSELNVQKNIDGSYSFNCIKSGITPRLRWNFTAPKSGLYLVSSSISKGDDIKIIRNGSVTIDKINMDRPYIACAGYFSEGDTITVQSDLEQNAAGTAKLGLYLLNQQVFEQGYEMMKRNVMETTYFKNGGKMEGTINADRDGLLYTSIPYEKGWTAYVDGEETEITAVGGSVIAFELKEGEHEITLKYIPNGFVPGLLFSLICLAAFVFFCVMIYIFGRKLIPEYAKDKAYKTEAEAQTQTQTDDYSETGTEDYLSETPEFSETSDIPETGETE